MPTFVVSDHAIDRYLERIGGGLTREEVVALIHDNSAHALPLKKLTADGGICYKLPSTPITLVCRRDPGRTEVTVVTILSAAQTERKRIPDEELEILREAAEERELWAIEIAKRDAKEKAEGKARSIAEAIVAEAKTVKPAAEAARKIEKAAKKKAEKAAAPPARVAPLPPAPPIPIVAPTPPFVPEANLSSADLLKYCVEKQRLKTERMKLAVELDQEMYRGIIRTMARWIVAHRGMMAVEAFASVLEQKHPWVFEPKFLQYLAWRDGPSGVLLPTAAEGGAPATEGCPGAVGSPAAAGRPSAAGAPLRPSDAEGGANDSYDSEGD